ncbi:MAG: DNA-binding protein [Eubacterium sp.]|jgi:predicted DNA-binding protein YlxM (UPF0122 family)|nr:DNA-binding protein [Eubacterium sp.]MBQ2053819.1 DNA-binding protein [Eubacterium sp.]MEE3398528.1 DNA-binding protein [Eubacterium sp.]
MDERLRKSLLYDFYGELLTEHQKAVFSAAIFDDMSYSELAEEFDCSRQAAFDLIRRINNKLEGYETKLGLLDRFSKAKDKMQELTQAVKDMNESVNASDMDKKVKSQLISGLSDISSMSAEIFDEF